MAMLPGLRPLKEILVTEHYTNLSGAYDLYVQDVYAAAEARTYYMAKWIRLPADDYRFRYYVDDRGTVSLDKQKLMDLEMGNGGVYETPFNVKANGVYRFDITYEEAPNNSPAFVAYAIFNSKNELVEVSRADGWIGDLVPIPDSALGPKPPYNNDNRLSYPVFLVEPNWKTPVLERLEWLTDVLTSESGAEQRRKLRQVPRRSIEAAFIAHGSKRAAIDNYITGVGTTNGLVPLWYDKSIITSKSVAGSVDLFADIAYRDFNPNDVVIIRHAGGLFDYELNIVAELKSNGQMVLAYGLQKDAEPHDSVTPVRVARMLDMPNGTNHTDRVREYSIRFDTTERAAHRAQFTGLPIYSRTNLPVLTWVPNFKESQSLTFERQMFMLDNQISNAYVRDPGGQAYTGLQGTYQVYGRENMAAAKDVLYQLAGRLKEIHVPSGQDDIVLTRDVNGPQGALIAERTGYQQFGTFRQNVRRDILIELYDGTRLFNTIISARVVGDEEWLFLSETVNSIPRDAIRRISYMSRARLDTDAIEITRLTDSDGASQIPLVFRTFTERRVAPPVVFP